MDDKKKYVKPEAEVIELFDEIDTLVASTTNASIGDGENEEEYTII